MEQIRERDIATWWQAEDVSHALPILFFSSCSTFFQPTTTRQLQDENQKIKHSSHWNYRVDKNAS